MGQYMQALARRKWMVLAATVLAAAAAFATSYIQEPAYRATATLAIPATPGAADVIAGSGRRSSEAAQETAQLQLLRLRSRLFADEVRRRLKLEMSTDALLAKVSAEPDPNAPSAFSVTVSDTNGRRAALIANAYANSLVAVDARESARDLTKAIKEIDRKLAVYDKKIGALSARMDAAQARASILPRAADGAPPASTAVKTRVYARWVKMTDSYNALEQKKDELILIRAAIGTPIQVIEYAVAPTAPTGENPLGKGVLGMLAGMMLGISGVFVLEYFDDAIKTKGEVEKYFASPVLGELAKPDPGGRNEPVMKTQPMSPAAEAYRLLRTNLLFETRRQSARSLLLAEVFPNGGGAPVVVNLATSFAQAGFRVLLVCSNGREGGAASYLGIGGEGGKGLSDWLIDGGSVHDFVLDTQLDGLRLIPPGRPVHNPTELLSSEAMGRLPEDLAETYHFVLLEAPPVLETADASVLAQDVDGVVLIAGLGRLNAETAAQARDRLDGVKARLLGVVVVK